MLSSSAAFLTRLHHPRVPANLALVPEHRALLEDFRARLETELKRTNAELLKNLPVPK